MAANTIVEDGIDILVVGAGLGGTGAAWEARFLHALRCLGAGAPVKQAALDAGYQSPSAFIAAFRAALDTTPGRYFQAGRP